MNSEIINGDCLEELKKLPENSIDSIVTDPPAGISFMGKNWDSDKGGRDNWIAWMQEVATECKRVLKPGGHAFVWAIPRTSHWTATAWENAGFEIRDIVAHIFGCLSEDTEILTMNGWKHYHKDIVLNPVLCYNVDKNSFEFHKPLRDFIYENKHPTYRIKSDKTDQIVSRNHRVLVERDGRKVFIQAETLERQENIPFLESLPDLSEAISDYNKRTGNKEKELSGLSSQNNGQVEHREVQKPRKGLPLLWKTFQTKMERLQTRQVLLSQLPSEGNIRKALNKVFSFRQGWLDRREYEKLSDQNDRGQKPCLERWSNLFQEARELFTNKICQVSARVFNNGTERQLHNGTPLDNGSITGSVLNQNGSSPSYQSQSAGQSAGESNVISDKQSPQITRGTITPIEYKGKVWCVEVPTGAFVARRNGQIFITGNSGFPKSLNIGVAVNKLETKEWSAISKALDNIDQKSIIEVWNTNSNNVKIAEAPLEKNQTAIGICMPKNDSVHESVTESFLSTKYNASVSIAENSFIEIQAQFTKESIVQQNVEKIITEISELQNLATSAERLQPSDPAMQSMNIFTVQCDVKEWLNENTEVNHKVDEALKTLRGNKKYSNEEITNVLCVALTDILNLTILNQSKTFQGLDITQKMECVSVINVIITEYIMDNLISNTVAILKSKAVDKLRGNEREVVGKNDGRSKYDRAERKQREEDNRLISTGADKITKTKGTSAWEGWGSALKPAREDWILMRKPIAEKTIAENVLKYGTGGINIDVSRVSAYIDGDNSENIVLSHKLSELRHKLHTLLFSCVADKKDCPTPASDVECVEMWKKLADCLGDCLLYSRLYDELSPLFLKGDQVSVQQLHDALGDIDRLRTEQSSSLSSPHSDHPSSLDDFYQLILSYLNDTTLYIKKQVRKRHGGGSSDIFPERGNLPEYPQGRFPANIIHDNSEEVRECFPETKSGIKEGGKYQNNWMRKTGIDSEVCYGDFGNASRFFKSIPQGRFPANLIHDNSEEVRECFPETKTGAVIKKAESVNSEYSFSKNMITYTKERPSNSGNASRFFKSIIYQAEKDIDPKELEILDKEIPQIFFDKWKEINEIYKNGDTYEDLSPIEEFIFNIIWFYKNEPKGKSIIYQSKASKSERNKGCEGLEEKPSGCIEARNRESGKGQFEGNKPMGKNNHPTVKPIALMEYLINMITPKNGTVLDPFAGSFSTGVACIKNGFNFIGIEKEEEYCKIAERRINAYRKQGTLSI